MHTWDLLFLKDSNGRYACIFTLYVHVIPNSRASCLMHYANLNHLMHQKSHQQKQPSFPIFIPQMLSRDSLAHSFHYPKYMHRVVYARILYPIANLCIFCIFGSSDRRLSILKDPCKKINEQKSLYFILDNSGENDKESV